MNAWSVSLLLVIAISVQVSYGTFLRRGGGGHRQARKRIASEECICTATGDPHYRSFDGVRFDFQGSCKYILTESVTAVSGCGFSVRAHNGHRGFKRVSWTDAVEIKFMNHVFVMGQRFQLLVDGAVCHTRAVSEGNNIRIFMSGSKMTFISQRCGIQVEWNGRANVHVRLHKSWANKVRGLCGNCNSNSRDDITSTLQGTRARNVYEFATSFIVSSKNANAECQVKVRPGPGKRPQRPIGPEPLEPEVPDPEAHPCVGEWATKVTEMRFCGAFLARNGPFGQCIRNGRVKIDELYQSCRFDVCTSKNDMKTVHEIVCESLSNFADECCNQGFDDIEWRDACGCGESCGKNMVYTPKMDPCPASCDNIRENKCECCEELPLTEGCQCKQGFVLLGDQCVHASQCPANREITLTFTKRTTTTVTTAGGGTRPVGTSIPIQRGVPGPVNYGADLVFDASANDATITVEER